MSKAYPAKADPVAVDGEPTVLHRAIYRELVREISEGVYRAGDRLPSEAQL